jgi:hypothetical protein
MRVARHARAGREAGSRVLQAMKNIKNRIVRRCDVDPDQGSLSSLAVTLFLDQGILPCSIGIQRIAPWQALSPAFTPLPVSFSIRPLATIARRACF